MFGRACGCCRFAGEAAADSPLNDEEASVAESASTDNDAARTPNALGRMLAIHGIKRAMAVRGS
jgi:hypothetical protein